jgi:hypothetical protein
MNRRAPLSAAGRGRSALALALALGVLAALACGAAGRARAAIRRRARVFGAGHPGQLPGTWKLLPSAPVTALPPAYSIASVWTGHEMIIHGIAITPLGGRGVNFAYHPAANTWTRLPSGPKPVLAQLNDVAVRTGSQMLVLGLTSAAYNPAASTWHPVPRPNLAPGPISGWIGRGAVMWEESCCGRQVS